jgi:hypothetical protein
MAWEVGHEPLGHHLAPVRIDVDKPDAAATMLVPDKAGAQAVGLAIGSP